MSVVQQNPSSTHPPRKFRAVRSLARQEQKHTEVERGSSPTEVVVSSPPWLAGTRKLEGASRVEIYSLVNDRYPGAPGTATAQAEESKERSVKMQRRESNRRKAARAEWERLGLQNLGKKRKSSSPYASEAGSTAGSNAGSDTESSIPSRASRTRRISSRHGTPAYVTEPESVPSRLAVSNAPVHPSPLATNAVLPDDPVR